MAEEEVPVDAGEEKPPPEKPPAPPLSELQLTIGEQAKYIADHFDKLYESLAALKTDLAATESRLRTEMDGKMKADRDALTLRIEALERLTIEHGIKISEAQSTIKQQANQLDDLQNHVGVLFFRLH